MKEHRKIVPLVHLEVVGNAKQTDEQVQKAEVIQEIDFYCTISYGVPCQVCFVRAWLGMQSCFIFVVMEKSIFFPELLLLFPVLEWFRDTNL